jgi:hypothetical protein
MGRLMAKVIYRLWRITDATNKKQWHLLELAGTPRGDRKGDGFDAYNTEASGSQKPIRREIVAVRWQVEESLGKLNLT